VSLLGDGVALQANTQYWLVASPDNVNAPDFFGKWQITLLTLCAFNEPGYSLGWTDFNGDWFGAEIRGTSP
jgi:hypothetical protein